MSKYIIENLVRLMIQVEQLEELKTGKEKKQYVLDQLKIIMQLDPHIEYLIIEFIDLLIQVDKHNITFNKDIKPIKCFDYLKNLCQ